MHKILTARKLAENIFWMDVEAPYVAKNCHPGQFLIDPETGTYLNDPSQDGRFMHGVVLLEETKEPYASKDIKVYSYGSAKRR